MKLAIIFIAWMALAASAGSNHTKIVDKTFLEKQKFLLEIVYRVEEPLMFEEWLKLSDTFIVDKSYYMVSRIISTRNFI